MSHFEQTTQSSKNAFRLFGKFRKHLSNIHRGEQGSEAIINVVLLAMGAMVCLFLWNDIWTGKIRKWVTDTTTSILAD
jgi:hypothetical protein